MTALLDPDAMTSADFRELASAKAMQEDRDAPRAPLPPIVVEDQETADAWERLRTNPETTVDAKRRRVWVVTEEKERMEAQKALRERMTTVQRFFDENGGPGNPNLTRDEQRDSWKLVEQLHVATNRWLELNR